MEIAPRPDLQQFSKNKEIPKKYEYEILIALSHYPELKDTKIRFSLAVHASVPYGTKPTFKSCFTPRKNRAYIITILESAEYPESAALMKRLTREMRIGVLGHELAHVKQFQSCNPFSLLKRLASFLVSSTRRTIERAADKMAIAHGLGQELLEHALYIRSIPGYVKKRPKLNEDYLLPREIEYYLEHPEKISAA